MLLSRSAGTRLAALGLSLGLSLSSFAQAPAVPKTEVPTPPSSLSKAAPESVEDLKAIQKQTRAVLNKVMAATVGLRVGVAQGSGVIVSKDGLVLTAGHVSGEPDKEITIILPDGRQLKGKTLGMNRGIDSGMAKITTPGEYPYVEMGKSAELKKGQWCVAVGHPGGFKSGRTPVVRVGRVGDFNEQLIQTDCTLVGGDSGGPLYDMMGRLIGIHSRIGPLITTNIHVPVDTYRDTWDQLVKGDKIGSGNNASSEVWFGVKRDSESKDCKIAEVTPMSPAAKAGLRSGDLVLRFDGREVKNYDELLTMLVRKKPGDIVDVEVLRGEDTRTIKVTLAKRPG